jgi:acyl-CoA synthetase (AMP-forming)/AMP-acid ligase II
MICLWLFQDGQALFVPDEHDLVGGFVSSLARGVDAVSATPTFMRYVLLTNEEQELRRAKMQTLTLGGEIVDQAILDRLSHLWPGCTLRHIYASTEVGAAIVVQDGREGFPAALLERGDAGRLQLKDDRLLVRSKFASRSVSGSEWVETGDLVEVVGDRVLFRGRAGSAMINVGGMKAFPAEIEAALLGHPEVLWARVRARRAPLVGSLPAAQVVLTPSGAGLSDAERQLSDFLRGRVPDHAVPRLWEFLDVVPATPSLKS